MARLTSHGPPSLAAARLGVTCSSPSHSQRLQSLATACHYSPGAARVSEALVTRRGAVRVARRGSKSLDAARVRVNRSSLPSLTAACRHLQQLTSLADHSSLRLPHLQRHSDSFSLAPLTTQAALRLGATAGQDVIGLA